MSDSLSDNDRLSSNKYVELLYNVMAGFVIATLIQ